MATVITATLGTSKIKVCEINNSLRVTTIEKAFTMDTPEGYIDDGRLLNIEGLAQVINDELLAQNITSKDIIFVLKSTKIVYKEVFVPVLKESKLKAMIKANASDYFPMDVENYIIADKIMSQVVTPDGEKQYRVGLYAAASDMVEGYYRLAELLGKNIKNIESYNNANVAFLNKQVDAETSVVIHIHDDNSTVNIYKNNILELQRNVPYGKSVVINAVMEKMNVTEKEAEEIISTRGLIHSRFDGDEITESLRYFINSITRVVDYYTSRSAENVVEKAYLTGEAENILGLDSLMANEFAENLTRIKKFRDITVAPSFRFDAKMIAKYISCVGAVYEPVNFVPDKLEGVKKDMTIRYLLIGVAASLGIGLVALTVPIIQNISLGMDISDMEEKIDAIKDVEVVVNNYYNSKDKLSDALNFAGITSSANDSLLEFFSALEKGMPSDVSIKGMTVNNGQVSISAVTSTKQSIAKFITQLNSMPGVSGAFVSSSAESKDEYGVISSSFSITFSFNSGIEAYVNPETSTVEETQTEQETEGEVE